MKYLTLLLMIVSLKVLGQEPPINEIQKLGPNPYFILDSSIIQQVDLEKIDPNQISSLTILIDTSANRKYGDDAKDGAVIIETKAYARQKFTTFFRQVSSQYDSLFVIYGSDSTFQYILNDKVQNENYEGNLSIINKDLLIEIGIINSDQLFTIYGITIKKYGIIVKAKKPTDLYRADEKF